MRVVAGVPSMALLVGCAAGAVWPDPAAGAPVAVVAGACALAVVASVLRLPLLLLAAVAVGAAAGGARLSSAAWHEAWRPPLRIVFEEIALAQRRGAASNVAEADGLSAGGDRGADRRATARRAAGGRANGHGVAGPDGPTPEPRAAVVLVGRLRADASLSEAGAVSLELEAEQAGRADGAATGDRAANPVRGGVRLSVGGSLAPGLMHEWRRGRSVRLVAQLRRPSRYLDPGVPDGERSLARRGVTLIGSVKSGSLVTVVARGGWWTELGGAVRAFARAAIAGAVGRWSAQSAGIITAIVIGDRTGLDNEVERRLQDAGTYHVIAISGGNIAILAALALAVFRVAGLLGRAAMLTAMAGLLAYAEIVSGGASVERATWMAVAYFGARALDLRGPPLNALAVVAAGLVLAQPLAVADPGFLITSGATLAILLVPPGWPRAVEGWKRAVASTGIASAATEVALLPVGAWCFGRVTVAGLALNYVAIPLMAVAQIAGMVCVPLAAVSPPLAGWVGWVAHAGATGLVRSAALVEVMPVVAWRVAPPAAWVLAAYYASAIVAVTLWLRARPRHVSSDAVAGVRWRRPRQVAVVVGAAAAAWIGLEPWAWRRAAGDGRLHVTFLDVGQGDAALVRFPRGRTWLVDAGGVAAGGGFDVGERVVAPVLRDAGVRRLDTFVLTHADADHVGGAAAILDEFRPRDVWEGVPVPGAPPLQALRRVAERQGSRWLRMQRGDHLEIDGVEVDVGHPPPPDWERQEVRNDDSVVIELRWRDVSIVLTGDIGREVEQDIAPHFARLPLRVLKVPHHGSQSSSSAAFLDALRPQVAVISAGRGNPFGHPALAVLRRYVSIDAAVFRTDCDGAVTIGTDGHALEVSTFTGRTQRLEAQAR